MQQNVNVTNVKMIEVTRLFQTYSNQIYYYNLLLKIINIYNFYLLRNNSILANIDKLNSYKL